MPWLIRFWIYSQERKQRIGEKNKIGAERYYGIKLDHHKADSDSRACTEILIRYMQADVKINEYVRSWWMK